MMQYTVARVRTPDWKKIPAVELAHTGWLPSCPITATAQLCHDGESLYVRMEARESDIRAQLSHPLDQVCEDSCLEFFFAPCQGDSRYFNFEFNPLGNFYLGFGRQRETRARLLPGDLEPFQIAPYQTEQGWGITYRIPGSFISMYVDGFSFSGKAACNFYKCGELTAVPHYLAWAPLHSAEPDYHRREDFGTLIFE